MTSADFLWQRHSLWKLINFKVFILLISNITVTVRNPYSFLKTYTMNSIRTKYPEIPDAWHLLALSLLVILMELTLLRRFYALFNASFSDAPRMRLSLRLRSGFIVKLQDKVYTLHHSTFPPSIVIPFLNLIFFQIGLMKWKSSAKDKL